MPGKIGTRVIKKAIEQTTNVADSVLFPRKTITPYTLEEKQHLQTSVTSILNKGRVVTRPTKKFQELAAATEKIIDCLTHGAPMDLNFLGAYSGVSPAKLREWMALGHSKPRSAYGAFLRLIQEAVVKCDVNDLKTMSNAAGRGEWEASAARLKMRGFGQSDKNIAPVEVKIINYTDKPAEITVSAQPLLENVSNNEMLDKN